MPVFDHQSSRELLVPPNAVIEATCFVQIGSEANELERQTWSAQSGRHAACHQAFPRKGETAEAELGIWM